MDDPVASDTHEHRASTITSTSKNIRICGVLASIIITNTSTSISADASASTGGGTSASADTSIRASTVGGITEDSLLILLISNSAHF